MSRTIKDAQLDSRAARRKLAARAKPYFRMLEPGLLSLGYRRTKASESGRWIARRYLGDGRYETTKIGLADDFSDADSKAILSFKDAQEAARRVMTDKAAAGATEPASAPLLVSEALRAYLQMLKDRGGRAFIDASYRAELVSPELAEIEAAKLRADQIRQWHRDLADTPARVRTKEGEPQRYRAPSQDPESVRRRRATANRALGCLRAALNFSFREGRIPSDTEWRRVRPFEDVEAARPRWLTVVEAQRLLNACDTPEFHDLCAAALLTGMRYGELSRLVVADFDADARSIHVRFSKSGKSRDVPLNAEAVEFFGGLAAGRAADDIMLKRPDGEAWKHAQQCRPFQIAAARAGLSKIGFHGLRHSYASLSVKNGSALLIVSRALGHSTTRMTERHYAHLAPDFLGEEVRRTSPVFGLPPSKVKKLA